MLSDGRVELVIDLDNGECSAKMSPVSAEDVAHYLLLAARSARGLPVGEAERRLVATWVLSRSLSTTPATPSGTDSPTRTESGACQEAPQYVQANWPRPR